MELNTDFLKVIGEILERGNTAEVKMRKDDIIVLETKRKIEHKMPLKRE